MAEEFDGDPTAGMVQREININQADFTPAPSSGEAVSAGEVEEIGRAEIGTDGQFVSYELVQPGRELGETGNSARGKGYAQLMDDSGEGDPVEVDGATEVRLIARPINQDETNEILGWMKHRDLNIQDPDKRLEIPPATEQTSSGEEADEFVRHGRVLAIQVRHPSQDVTVSLHASDISIPAYAFY